jgi:hypothetical protein
MEEREGMGLDWKGVSQANWLGFWIFQLLLSCLSIRSWLVLMR